MTREEAAKICQSIKFILDNDDYSEEVEEALDMAIEAIQQMPKRGKWRKRKIKEHQFIQNGYELYYCSECYKNYSNTVGVEGFDYCPNCGARMEEEQ